MIRWSGRYNIAILSMFILTLLLLLVTLKDDNTRIACGIEADEVRMREKLRIFVYDDLKAGREYPNKEDYKYAAEVVFAEQLRASAYAVSDGRVANAFFIPIRCAAYRFAVSDRVQGGALAAKTAQAMIAELRERYPYWDRNQGVDHFYVCSHDMGVEVASTSARLRLHAIAMVHSADTDDIADESQRTAFVPGKDLSIPPTSLDINALTHFTSATHRKHLAFIAGTMSRGRVRPRLLDMYKTSQYIRIFDNHMALEKYVRWLHTSEFCLVVRGNRGWSPRLIDAIVTGCIPVVIADHYELPLQGIVDWASISVRISENDIGDLQRILERISATQREAMRTALSVVAPRFVWQRDSHAVPSRAFESVLLLLFRRLNL